MKVELLEPHGFCAGVKAALAAVRSLRNVHCLHQLVHNELVVDELKSRGFTFIDSIAQAPDGATIVFSAHGVSPACRRFAEAHGMKIVDTTCPFVRRVHEAAREFVRRGLAVVVVGDAGHDEVEGVVGEIEEAGGTCVVLTSAERCPAEWRRVAVVAQTTTDPEVVDRVVADLARTREVETMAEPCNATRLRQRAVRDFAGDALIVLGSENSANCRRLCTIARQPSHLAGTLRDVERALAEIGPCRHLGVTAGASTPESFVEAAMAALDAKCKSPIFSLDSPR